MVEKAKLIRIELLYIDSKDIKDKIQIWIKSED